MTVRAWWPAGAPAPDVSHVGQGSDIEFVRARDGQEVWISASTSTTFGVPDDAKQVRYVPTTLGAAIAAFLTALEQPVPTGLQALLLKSEPVPEAMRTPDAGWAVLGDRTVPTHVHDLGDGSLVVTADRHAWLAVWIPVASTGIDTSLIQFDELVIP